MSSIPQNDEIFALVDCNSFYCSCERVFNPKIRNKPVIVLSNNDGCAVSLTSEAKALGIPMGAPIFKFRDLVEKNGVEVFSSNYTLYGDMSQRVMSVLSEFTPELEIYSIDEAFLSLKGFQTKDLTAYGKEIKQKVYQYTGIPVSIGIAPTKVLAKLANKIAKKNGSGVLDLCDLKKREEALRTFPVEDIWGIGKKSTEKLRRLGIHTAEQLKNAPEKTIRHILTVVGSRILRELQGESCIELERDAPHKKQIISSRSFGTTVLDLPSIQEALSNHITRACEKLRKQNSVCFSLQVFMHTNRFKNTPQYFNVTSRSFLTGLDTTNHLIAHAKDMAQEIYREGFLYKKCGVMFLDIRPKDQNQLGLFDAENTLKFESIMKLMDQTNKKMGADTLKFASCGIKKHWKMKSEKRSACFTTRWSELIKVS